MQDRHGGDRQSGNWRGLARAGARAPCGPSKPRPHLDGEPGNQRRVGHGGIVVKGAADGDPVAVDNHRADHTFVA